jgi:hypothetical protein
MFASASLKLKLNGLTLPQPQMFKGAGRDKLSMAQAKRVEPHLWYQLRAK